MTKYSCSDEAFFLSQETRLALIIREGRLTLLHSHLNEVPQFTHLALMNPTFKIQKVLNNAKHFHFLIGFRFIQNSAFAKPSEFTFLTFASIYPAPQMSPMLNDLKYLSLLVSRFSEFQNSKVKSDIVTTSVEGLNFNNTITNRSFGQKRRFFLFELNEHAYYGLNIVFLQDLQDIGISPKSSELDSTKGQNIEFIGNSLVGHCGEIQLDSR